MPGLKLIHFSKRGYWSSDYWWDQNLSIIGNGHLAWNVTLRYRLLVGLNINQGLALNLWVPISTLRQNYIFQTTFSNVFLSMKILDFLFKPHCNLVLDVESIISHRWFRWRIGAEQATNKVVLVPYQRNTQQYILNATQHIEMHGRASCQIGGVTNISILKTRR